jgi:5-methylcytosine-specific restriction protein A
MPWDPKPHNPEGNGKKKKQHPSRPDRRHRGYDHTWSKIRLAVLREDPVCVKCLSPATVVDHIKPLKDGGSNDRLNLQPMCASCHNSKTWHETWEKKIVRKKKP